MWVTRAVTVTSELAKSAICSIIPCYTYAALLILLHQPLEPDEDGRTVASHHNQRPSVACHGHRTREYGTVW